MARLKLISQRLMPKTHAGIISEMFGAPDIELGIISVAYVRASGVTLLADALRSLGNRVLVFAGIGNGTTSLLGLSTLLECHVKLNVVYSDSSVLFHPKVFLVKSNKEMRILVGSANLTEGGLRDNIETSIHIHLNLENKSERSMGERLLEALILPLERLAAHNPDIVYEINDKEKLFELTEQGLLESESSLGFSERKQEPRSWQGAGPLMLEYPCTSEIEHSEKSQEERPSAVANTQEFLLTNLARGALELINISAPWEKKCTKGCQLLEYEKILAENKKIDKNKKPPLWEWRILGHEGLGGTGFGDNAKSVKRSAFEIGELLARAALVKLGNKDKIDQIDGKVRKYRLKEKDYMIECGFFTVICYRQDTQTEENRGRWDIRDDRSGKIVAFKKLTSADAEQWEEQVRSKLIELLTQK